VKVFGLIFALGIATGIVMEFQFGTNWSTYSRFVGDVFGSALAAEGIFAFFLESGFLAILIFGWNKVSEKMHFFSTVMVFLGAHFSAIWIVVANSWQQTPAGHHIVETEFGSRAEILDFWEMVFNPSSVDRIWHVYMGCWQAGAFFVLSVAAWYLLKKKHADFAKASIKVALLLAATASILQLVSGHQSAVGVAENQPAKMAAFEGHYPDNEPAGMYLFGWVNEEDEKVLFGPEIPGLLSFLIHGDSEEPITGLRAFPPEDRPPVNIVFQSYHAMVAIGMILILLAWLSLFYWWRGSLFEKRWLLWLLVPSVLLPQAANQLGWISAEVGRQPYIVHNLLRTEDALSTSVTSGEVLTSIILFSIVYAFLFALFLFLLNEKIQHGPAEEDLKQTTSRARADA
jgi:cytochrome d ubiquinol oxidase subunit I